MTEEQIKQKAEAEADKVIIGSGMDRASVIHLKHLLVTMYMQGAIENGIQWHKDRYSPNGKDRLLPCGKVEGYYRVILYDNYREPQIVRPESEIEFIGNQREHIIVWGEIPQFKE